MFDREYFEKNEFVKKIYSFENLQCIEDQNDVMHFVSMGLFQAFKQT